MHKKKLMRVSCQAVAVVFLIAYTTSVSEGFMYLKEYTKGDKTIGTLYMNDQGLVKGKNITPKLMGISIARHGKILYQMKFFKEDEKGKRLPQFTLGADEQVPVGGQNPIKGIIMFLIDETKKEATHTAVLSGKLKIGDDFLAYFTGSVIFADEQRVQKYKINNRVIKEGNEVILKEGDEIPITDNLLD